MQPGSISRVRLTVSSDGLYDVSAVARPEKSTPRWQMFPFIEIRCTRFVYIPTSCFADRRSVTDASATMRPCAVGKSRPRSGLRPRPFVFVIFVHPHPHRREEVIWILLLEFRGAELRFNLHPASILAQVGILALVLRAVQMSAIGSGCMPV